MYKHLECIGKSLIVFLVFSVPSWAQFEVSPDHFDSDKTVKKVSSQTVLQTQIEDLQGQIESYEASLRAKSAMVEESRQEAISAGIQGDGAGSYIHAYRLQERQLESLRQSLNAQIALTRNEIARLQGDFSLVAAKAHAVHPLNHRKHNTKLLVAASSAKSLTASRRSFQ